MSVAILHSSPAFLGVIVFVVFDSPSAARCLGSLLTLINQCIGDAVSDMLLVEVALYHVSNMDIFPNTRANERANERKKMSRKNVTTKARRPAADPRLICFISSLSRPVSIFLIVSVVGLWSIGMVYTRIFRALC